MTINEIAEMAGVSRATVSRYLNQGYVSEEKKEAIRRVIEETGYQPSAVAQTMRSKVTKFIGVIIPRIDSDSISRMVAGIGDVLSEQGYQLLLANTNNNEKEELKFLNLFKENHVDGIILLGTIFTPDHRKALRSLSVPAVILGQQLSGYSCVYFDDFGAACEMTGVLIAAGTSFGCLAANLKDNAVGRDRKNGFLNALENHGLPSSSGRVLEARFSMESGYEQARALFERYPEIDSLFCATDRIAAGAMKYIKETKRRIPEDVQIAGIGDSRLSQVTTPALSTVHLHYRTAGREAARLLIEQIQEGESATVKELKLGFKLSLKESTR